MDNLLVSLLNKADAGGYAIPHFNCSDCWEFMAVIEAAREEEAPVIAAVIQKVLDVLPPDVFAGMARGAGIYSKIPVVSHLDHSKTVKLCRRCTDAGFTSVMIDGSQEPLNVNIGLLKETVSYAHSMNVCVEGEIGKIKGRDYESKFGGGDFLAQVDDAVELVKQGAPDLLAVGIGTAHGFYTEKPEINFKRLAEINKAIDIPLVLHGGTGIPEEDVKKAIRNGINKVNVGTQIRYTNMITSRKLYLAENFDPNTHPADMVPRIINPIKEVCRQWIRTCMANGKA
jgi:ketose-bisphosphate aldolase